MPNGTIITPVGQFTVSDQIVKRRLSDEVLERLSAMIKSGQIGPGERLPSERELMARYGVGRPAVREALQSLERMGLIDIHHGERARVATLNARSIFDLIDRSARHLLQTCPQTYENMSEARLHFEVGMIRLAVARSDEADVQHLEEALVRLKAAAGDLKAFVAADMAFHSLIASFSKNPLYAAISEFLLRWLFDHFPALVSAPGAESLTIAEHQVIYDRLAARDEDGAVKAMTDHLTRANPLYRKYLIED
jgi:GntR family transcriptional regulator, sialic acid-inducible nan operon repressor